jgi:hypothetical protein
MIDAALLLARNLAIGGMVLGLMGVCGVPRTGYFSC